MLVTLSTKIKLCFCSIALVNLVASFAMCFHLFRTISCRLQTVVGSLNSVLLLLPKNAVSCNDR